MPIRRFLGRDTFDPAHLAVMGAAFTAALDKLGLKKQNDPVVQVLARKIIWAARNGERDQKKLCDHAVWGAEEDWMESFPRRTTRPWWAS